MANLQLRDKQNRRQTSVTDLYSLGTTRELSRIIFIFKDSAGYLTQLSIQKRSGIKDGYKIKDCLNWLTNNKILEIIRKNGQKVYRLKKGVKK